MGGWASAKLLLDLYGHFLPTESTGFADALDGMKLHQTAVCGTKANRRRAAIAERSKKTSASAEFSGAPDRTRTCDPLLRRQLLYPAELPGRRPGE